MQGGKSEMEDFCQAAEDCLEFLKRHDNFLVCAHPYPDGDAIGCVIAMCDFLETTGKKAQGITFSTLPKQYEFLKGSERLLVFPEGVSQDLGALVCLDVGSSDRIEGLMKKLPESIPILNIDHHISNTNFGTVNWNSNVLSSTGEMLYNIFRLSGTPLSPAVSEALYVAIVTDTGRFCYRNTRPETLEAAAQLLRNGVDSTVIFHHVYETGTHNRLRLLTRALSTVETAFDDRVSWMTITQDMYEQTNSFSNDTYEFIDLLTSVGRTVAAILFRELDDGQTKISVRTDGSVNAHELCRNFGGGGHRCAAGTIHDGDLDEAVKDVLKVLGPMLESPGA